MFTLVPEMGASRNFETPWGPADEKDFTVAILVGLGLSKTKAAELAGFSTHGRVVQRMQEREGFYRRVGEIVEMASREARVETKEDWKKDMITRWYGLWEKAHETLETALDEGNIDVAREVLRDIRERTHGKPANKLELTGQVGVDHQHTHHLVPVELVHQLRRAAEERHQMMLRQAPSITVEPDDGSSSESN